MSKPKLYPNECVKKVVIGIPRDHLHVRAVIELCDQSIVLHEATIAAIARAFLEVVLHPVKKAVKLELKRVEKDKKPFYAEYQLLEVEEDEHRVVEELEKVLKEAEKIVCGCAKPADAEG